MNGNPTYEWTQLLPITVERLLDGDLMASGDLGNGKNKFYFEGNT